MHAQACGRDWATRKKYADGFVYDLVFRLKKSAVGVGVDEFDAPFAGHCLIAQRAQEKEFIFHTISLFQVESCEEKFLTALWFSVKRSLEGAQPLLSPTRRKDPFPNPSRIPGARSPGGPWIRELVPTQNGRRY